MPPVADETDTLATARTTDRAAPSTVGADPPPNTAARVASLASAHARQAAPTRTVKAAPAGAPKMGAPIVAAPMTDVATTTVA
jgi:hypothetical protein